MDCEGQVLLPQEISMGAYPHTWPTYRINSPRHMKRIAAALVSGRGSAVVLKSLLREVEIRR
jgi:hypothetical protein